MIDSDRIDSDSLVSVSSSSPHPREWRKTDVGMTFRRDSAVERTATTGPFCRYVGPLPAVPAVRCRVASVHHILGRDHLRGLNPARPQARINHQGNGVRVFFDSSVALGSPGCLRLNTTANPSQMRYDCARGSSGHPASDFFSDFRNRRRSGPVAGRPVHWGRTRGSGEIGIHAGFRYLCRKA